MIARVTTRHSIHDLATRPPDLIISRKAFWFSTIENVNNLKTRGQEHGPAEDLLNELGCGTAFFPLPFGATAGAGSAGFPDPLEALASS